MISKREQAAVFVIEEYLLKGQVAQEDVRVALDRLASSRYSRHLFLAGLADGFPSDETVHFPLLVRLRILFADFPEPEPAFVETLLRVCALHRLVTRYIAKEIDLRDFDAEFNRVRRGHLDESLNCMLGKLAYGLAVAALPAGDPHRFERIDLLRLCCATCQQLEGYWRSILGDA